MQQLGLTSDEKLSTTHEVVSVDDFHYLYDLVVKHPSVEEEPPNGMRPGVYVVKLGDYYLHAVEESGGMDLIIVLDTDKLSAYDLIGLSEKPYVIEHKYEQPIKQYGTWRYADVLRLVNNSKQNTTDRNIVVDSLHLTMTGALTSDKLVVYQKLVRDCSSKSNNAKSLAIALYDKWLKLGSTDKDLICIYKAMSLAALSTYELERLAKKRLIFTESGYGLEDCYHDTDVTLDSSTDLNYGTSDDNASCILDAYKIKYNISDNMWPTELERLQTLCNSADLDVIATYITDNFL